MSHRSSIWLGQDKGKLVHIYWERRTYEQALDIKVL